MPKVEESKTYKHCFGKRYYIEITTEGFTVWDKKEKRWILDGSTFRVEKEITISADRFMRPCNEPIKHKVYRLK